MIEITCLISAVFFLVSNILGFSFLNRIHKQGHSHAHSGQNHTSGWADFIHLDAEHIQDEFGTRHDMYFHELASGILNAIAWMVFCIPLIQVAWIQSRQGTYLLGTHVSIAALALGGSITELISRLMTIGTTATSIWLANRFNLQNWVEISAQGYVVASEGGAQDSTDNADMIGWRVLEVVHIVNRGLLLWIDAAEWLFLSAIFTLIYLSVVKSEESKLSRNWARLGLVMAALAFIDFSSDVLRLRSWMTFSTVAIFISVISRLFLMPGWLLWLGMQLPSIKLAAATEAAAFSASMRGVQEMPPRGGGKESYGSAGSGARPDTESSVFS